MCRGTVLGLEFGDYMTLGICQNSQKCTPKRVNFTVRKFKNKLIKAKKKRRKEKKVTPGWSRVYFIAKKGAQGYKGTFCSLPLVSLALAKPLVWTGSWKNMTIFWVQEP